METVIKKLSEIEAAAERIMADAREYLKVLDEDMSKRTKEFDDQVEQDTAKRLRQLKDKLQQENAAELNRLSSGTDESLKSFYENFEKKQDSLAEQIVRKIIEV